MPPLIRCHGIRNPAAQALNGIYEFQGVVDGRACYHQTGVSSGNNLWYSEHADDGPMWLITPKDRHVGHDFSSAIAHCQGQARWPWETQGWAVCGKAGRFAPAPHMRFDLVMPTAELHVHAELPLLEGALAPSAPSFRRAGEVNGRPAYRQAGLACATGGTKGVLRLFWMPRMGRWLLAYVKDGRPDTGGGIQSIAARSLPDSGGTWGSLWPWEATGWEMPTQVTYGLVDADAKWQPADGLVNISLASPLVTISGDIGEVPRSMVGLYEPRGMAYGRVYYVQRLELGLESSVGPKCLWFAEDRGQWVITDPIRLGDSRIVMARIACRAWWPWEAHLSGTTSPASIGSVPFATLPVWHGGAAVLASGRVCWEVADKEGTFHQARDMAVTMVFHKRCTIEAAPRAKHYFVGDYEYQGLLSGRPYFLQDPRVVEVEFDPLLEDEGERTPDSHLESDGAAAANMMPRYALWYADDVEQWVITEHFRLLDSLTVDARAADSAWFPWDVASGWEISVSDVKNDDGGEDGSVPEGGGGGGCFISEPFLRVQADRNS